MLGDGLKATIVLLFTLCCRVSVIPVQLSADCEWGAEALTQDFLHSSVAVVLNLQQPSFDARKRLNSTDVVDDYDAVRTSIEPMTIKTHPPKLGNDCQLAYGFLVVFFNNFVPKTHHFWDIRPQKCRDLENWVRGPSRSLEMSPCNTVHTTSYWHSIVTMALSHVVSKIFNVKKCRDLEIGVRGHSRSLKVVPFGRLCMVTLDTVTLKPRLGVTPGHRKW